MVWACSQWEGEASLGVAFLFIWVILMMAKMEVAVEKTVSIIELRVGRY